METATTPRARLHRGIVLLMAVATGLSVANNYYAQPLLAEIRGDLHLSSGVAGVVVTAAQLGYAAGLVFLLPLGDLVRHRRLVVLLTALNAIGLAAMASATNAPALLGAAVAVGSLSVVAQILVPYAASLAGEEERGRVVGTVMSGLLLGILLARTAAGYLAQIGGWPTVYWVAAVLMLVLAAALRFGLPDMPQENDLGYPALLRSVLTLIRREPVLRLRMAYGAVSFAMFSVLWTSLTFLLAAPPYRYSAGTIGLFGLIGAAGAVGANVAGRIADRGGARWSTMAAMVLLFGSWPLLGLGAHSLAALIAGIIVLDLACQLVHITNQSQIYALSAAARSRLNSAYMTAYFGGGAAGSAMASVAYASHGWTGVCVLGGVLGAIGVALWGCTARMSG